MCAKDDLVERKSLLLTSTSNHVDTFGLDFAFSFAITISIRPLIARGNNILSLIAFIISYYLFADELNIQQSLLDRATVVLIIISRSTSSTLLAGFIPTTKIRDLFLKTLENTAKSRILLACADRRTRQCYLTICAILKHYNFNIYVSLATDILHLLLKGLVIKMLDFITSLKHFNNKRAFTEAIIQQLVAVVSLLFVSKAPFALHFIYAVCDLVTLAQYKRVLERINVFKEEFRVYQQTLEEEKNFNYPKYICTEANSEVYYITIVKQFYSITNKKETALLAANYATIVKQSRPSTTSILGIQPYLTKLLLSEVAANIVISNFIYAAAVFIYSSIKCWRSSGKRHNDSEYCDKEVLYLILTIIDYTCYDKDGKHIAYIEAFSKILLTIIRLVHLVLRDLPDLTTRTTMSYYVNNYIN
ncbi:hypothetical protein HBI80_015840 [Parastagonospora nodorum]|nr:hypothetical protein HBI80_015840 [Parastagonospora nodorum]